jgi:O-antigen chain-terminating methyltransferase
LGCGRGEWLEVVGELGYDARGVDLDDAMLSACRERGLRVQTGDALEILRGEAEETNALVSGFHIVEHLHFRDLDGLVGEALRILKPGGVLILETPNPENIIVGSSKFYLDPTHNRPIPPPLLAFLVEYHGFERVKVLRLQESPDLARSGPATLLDVLGGVSPDYAVVAQKAGDEGAVGALGEAFDGSYGLPLERLTAQYDERVGLRLEEAYARAAAAEMRATLAEQTAAEARSLATAAELRASELSERAAEAHALASAASATLAGWEKDPLIQLRASLRARWRRFRA